MTKNALVATQVKIEFDQIIKRGCRIDIYKAILVVTV